MESQITNDLNKKHNFEELSKDELVKKCYHLLTIAQKAKQAKNSLQEENNKLKEEISKNSFSVQEITEKLVQQKLALVTTVDELKTQNDFLSKKLKNCETEFRDLQQEFNSIDNENVSYKRRISRLTNENEQLISDLDSLEKQIEILNEIGEQQKEQLLQLEKSKSQEESNENTRVELQGMLSVSLEEIHRLKSENDSLASKIQQLDVSLEEIELKNHRIIELEQQIQGQTTTNNTISESNLKLREKLKLYHSKIVKLASTTKSLKEEKNSIIYLFKSYTNQVKEWQEQLNITGKKIISKIGITESQNATLKDNISHLETEKSDLEKTVKNYEKDLVNIKQEIDGYKMQLLESTDAKDNIVKELNELQNLQIKLQEEVAFLKEENQNLMKLKKQFEENESKQTVEESLQKATNSTENYTKELNELSKEFENILQKKTALEREIESLRSGYNVTYNKLLQENESLLEDRLQKIEEYEQQIGSHTEEVNKLKKELQAVLQEKTALTGQVEELKTVKDNYNKLLQGNESLREELNHNLQEVEELKHLTENQTREINKLRKEFEEGLQENTALSAEVERLKLGKDHNDKLLQENESLKQKLEDTWQKSENKTKELNILRKDLEGVLQEKATLKTEIESLEAVKNDNYIKLCQENESLKMKLKESLQNTMEYKYQAENQTKELGELRKELKDILEENTTLKKEVVHLKDERDDRFNKLLHENQSLKERIEGYTKELNDLSKIILQERAAFNNEIETLTSEMDKLLIDNKNYKKQITDLNKEIKSYEVLGNRSSDEIRSLVEENKSLTTIIENLREKLDRLERSKNLVAADTQTEDNYLSSSCELEEQLVNLKRENAELLTEMNEMNQAIKERGETISKLEAHREEVLKKLQIYEAQANKNIDSLMEKEKLIEELTTEIEQLKSVSDNKEIVSLKQEIEILKEKLNANLENNYADNDTMSTSTISRTEEINRLKDLEGSWEERYGKLRNFAVKLKGKIRELTIALTTQQTENEELQKKLSVNVKVIQSLQSQSDKLQDDLDNSKKECKQYLNRLNSVANDISKDKQAIVSKDEIIQELKRDLENIKAEKQAIENWKKQVSAKIQTLRKELEANNLLKKEFEASISKLTADLEAKDQALKAEIENHRQTKSLLEQSNNECKKNSVLNLEMQDYERSVKETSKKLERQQEQVAQLKNQVESQKTTINALREQNKILEERVNNDENNLTTATSEISSFKKKIASLEEEIQEKDSKVQNVTQLLETSRSEIEELSTELSKVISEHQKASETLKHEREILRSQNLGLQQSLRELQDNLKLKTDEFEVIRKEYDSYKVRAQSVLRQNQSRDVSLEEKLSEEIASLAVQNSAINNQLREKTEKLEILEAKITELKIERESNTKKIEELENELVEIKNQYAQLSAKYEKIVTESAETVRSLKVHADTLSQCYRQQIAEQEVRHNREIIELQSRLEKTPIPIEAHVILPTMPREEGEGSESIESNNGNNPVHPVPLERLLAPEDDKEISRVKKLLTEQEQKVVHLTALLSDTEQDLIKHVQMNEVLKEEIRRQQRSVEREKHAENLEYLKNVVFKFITLNSGDERSRLVPVLNTILKLSPEETKQLNNVARGESSLKGWTNLLPTWSSPSKPQ